MQTFFSKELQEGLASANADQGRKKSRLKVVAGGANYPILRLWVEGLSIGAEHTTHLRGLVDVYDGARHILQCLIVASEVERGALICTFKRATVVLDHPALDYVKSANAPAGYLTRA